jgi:hypothetical protein
MNAFLSSLKADLLDRRIRAVLVLLAAALVAALAYALTGGGPAPVIAPLPSPGAASGVSGVSPVAVSPNPNAAVAETTSGSSHQRGGRARDPFTPLPGSLATIASHAGTGKSPASGSRSAKSEVTKATNTGGSAPSSKPSTPAKPKPAYHVSVLFGEVPAGTPPQNALLTPYEDLKFQQKLPNPQNRVLAFNGVTPDGKLATFKFVGEAILRGTATCLPSASQCQMIALAQSQSEELELLPAAGGPPVVWELQVVSITTSNASAASVGKGFKRRSNGVLAVQAAAPAPSGPPSRLLVVTSGGAPAGH